MGPVVGFSSECITVNHLHTALCAIAVI